MKKIFLITFVLSLFTGALFCQNVSENLEGIWEGVDRLVFFENDDNGKPHMAVVLKNYYGWYYDRAMEDGIYAQKEARIRNSATSKTAAKCSVSFSDDEILFSYSKHDVRYVNFRLDAQNMFFNFWDIIPVEGGTFYKGKPESDGILISSKKTPTDFYSFFQCDDGTVYKIRYWKSNMEYDPEAQCSLRLSDRDDYFFVPKMIYVEGVNYTCASGRRMEVRNPEKSALFDNKEVYFSSDGTFVALKKPVLTQMAGKKEFEDLMQIVKEANSRRKPDPEPLFPDLNLDYHWDLIDALENGNEIIKAVRERQAIFGIRGKDIGK